MTEKMILALDIGGTNIRAALIDENIRIIKRTEIPCDLKETPDTLIDRLLKKADIKKEKISSVGIGCPGPLDIKNGIMLTPPSLPEWHGFQIKKRFEEKYGCNVTVQNDANAAGYAEAVLGAGKDFNSVYYVTVSTGIGGAFVYNKNLVSGAFGVAGELFNIVIPESREISDGNFRLKIAGGRELEKNSVNIFGENKTAKDIFLSAEKGDKLSKKVLESSAELLGMALANISCTVDPHVFVLGGSMAICQPEYFEKICFYARKYFLPGVTPEIVTAKLGGDAGLIGAALLAKTKQTGNV